MLTANQQIFSADAHDAGPWVVERIGWESQLALPANRQQWAPADARDARPPRGCSILTACQQSLPADAQDVGRWGVVRHCKGWMDKQSASFADDAGQLAAGPCLPPNKLSS